MFRRVAILGALSLTVAASAVRFDVAVVSTGGDYQFTANAQYWEPGVSQLRPNPILNLTGPGNVATAVIVSEATARDNWWFTGQAFLTFEGGVYWNGSPDPAQHLRITSVIRDLDNGHEYTMVSELNHTGSSWAQGMVFIQPTRRLRWTDTIHFAMGSTGTLVRYQSTNHTMNMAQNVPEPTSMAFAIGGLALLSVRRRTNK